MDRQTLANYGWIVVVALILAVMLALATPFGKYVMDGVSSIASGYINASNGAMSDTNRQELVNEWEDKWLDSVNTNKGYDHNAPELHPDDGTGVYDGMLYRSGNYEYCYGYGWCEDGEMWSNICDCGYTYEYIGWAVRCTNDVEDPGPILESINGIPVTNMTNTFWNCTSLTTAPIIPNSITNMQGAFRYCESLTTAPVIPNGVTNMQYTFYYCESLTTTPKIPSSVTDMSYAFSNCVSLTTAPIIPNEVTSLNSTFYMCNTLKTYEGSKDADGDFSNYIIPKSVTNMYQTFYSCTNLTIAPKMPSNLINMGFTFHSCESLTTAPIVPSGVTNLHATFSGCTSLKTYHGNKDQIGNFTNYAIPSGVTETRALFNYCTLITGTISVPCGATVNNYTAPSTAIRKFYHIDSCNGSCGR